MPKERNSKIHNGFSTNISTNIKKNALNCKTAWKSILEKICAYRLIRNFLKALALLWSARSMFTYFMSRYISIEHSALLNISFLLDVFIEKRLPSTIRYARTELRIFKYSLKWKEQFLIVLASFFLIVSVESI